MYLIGIVGWKNSGKTTLIEKLIPALIAAGATVSTVKHTHHAVDLDQTGKDSHRHRTAGSHEVAIVSSARWALLHERRDQGEPRLDDIVARMAPVDILLVEGFKALPHDKIEIHRAAADGDLIAPTDATIRAVVTDRPNVSVDVPVFDLNDVDSLAEFILERSRGEPR